MLNDLFKRKKGSITVAKNQKIIEKCTGCKNIVSSIELEKHHYVCPTCSYHFPITAYERISSLIDEDTFLEIDDHLGPLNPLEFPEYLEKIKKDQESTNMKEAIVTGIGCIHGIKTVVGVMDSHFRMGSMGSVVGEKITRAIETAINEKLPFILFSASGGARMQEGIISLMQMAKTSVALERMHQKGLLFIAVSTHPTTGGVSASFASLGDINIAEPQALIGFAGRRIIEQTIREKLPDDFQTAEFLLKHGQLDLIVHRLEMKEKLATILSLHGYKKEELSDDIS